MTDGTAVAGALLVTVAVLAFWPEPPPTERPPPPERPVAAPAPALEPGPEPDVPPGVIGLEDRVPVARFAPEAPERFPGWERVLRSAVTVHCGGSNGSGVLIDRPDLVLTAAHAVMDAEGASLFDGAVCYVTRDGEVAPMEVESVAAGAFSLLPELVNHFVVDVTKADWAFVRLATPLQGGEPLRLARPDELVLERGHEVLNVAGPQENFPGHGMVAQVCRYEGTPPTSAWLEEDGMLVGRATPGADRDKLARYDCDVGPGGSGSPVVGWTPAGEAVVWGILTDSLRGLERCPEVGDTHCFTAGPLAPAIDGPI